MGRHGRPALGVMRPAMGIAAAAVILGAGVLAGCQGSGASSTVYLQKYDRRDFTGAKAEAVQAYASSTGPQREQAALIAGLSAQSLKQPAEAKRYLRPLLASKNPDIAGRAGAGLGLLARDEGDKTNAAKLFSEAAPKLTGDESAKAAMFAGDAYQSLGRADAAATQYANAKKAIKSPSLLRELADRTSGKTFTVQAGAFSSKPNAEKRARDVASRCVAMGLGQPRVITGTSGGKPMYYVYVGEFALRQDAAEAMRKVGVPEGTVAEAN